MKLQFGQQIQWKCKAGECKRNQPRVGLRKNNWLESTRLPSHKIIYFIYCWCYKLTSMAFCDRELEIAGHSIVDYNSFLREVCAWKIAVANKDKKIGGFGYTVEIDESVFSRRKNNAGRVLPQHWIFGGICRESRERFLVLVPGRKAATLLPIIRQRIAEGSTIISDCWNAYNQLGKEFEHFRVNHSINFVDPNDNTVHTQNVESMWRVPKNDNRRRMGTKRNFLKSYIAEYMWRSSMPDNADVFEEMLKDIKNLWPPGSDMQKFEVNYF